MFARLQRDAPKVRVYMDQGSRFRAAFMAAYADRIKARIADGFFVKVRKDANAYRSTTLSRPPANGSNSSRLKMGWRMSPRLRLAWMKLHMRSEVRSGKWGDKWIKHPLPIASESFKFICWQTDLGDYDEDHAARLLLRASLHTIDRFFMQTRRRLTMAERPVVSVRQQRTMWHRYGVYNPALELRPS